MGNFRSSSLVKTLKYTSESDDQFKYEIYRSSDGVNTFAVVYVLFEVEEDSDNWAWVVQDQEVILLSDGQHPDYADQEALKHFDENYFNA